ncbi:MAG: hypothetical protein GX046_00940 [Tissierellia bacterium]|nr:hypothetical protein [Tissierellia bacterium]
MNYQNKIHKWGRISLITAIILFISFPLISSIYFDAWPGWMPVFEGLLAIAPIYWTVGIIEALTFGPMLGSGGAYLGFVTGNLTAMKVPAALQAMEQAGAEPGSPEGEVISTLAIATSSIVTTLILFFGMLLLSVLRPLLEAPLLEPAFGNILPALFGGLGVVFIAKNWKLAVTPLLMMSLLFIIKPSLASAVSILVPLSALITMAVGRILYKKGKL